MAREGSIARAADKLRLAPPTISNQLRTLEQNLGSMLFVRRGRGLVLTDTGSLVAGYAEEVTRLGLPLSAEDAWHEYRGLAFQALMTAVVSLGLGSFTDSDAVMRAMLERSVAALHRLDYAGWLDTVLAEDLR